MNDDKEQDNETPQVETPQVETPNNTTITINQKSKEGTPSNQSAVSSLHSSINTSTTRQVSINAPTGNSHHPQAKRSIGVLDVIHSPGADESFKTNDSIEEDDDMIDGVASLGHSMPRYCVTTTKKSSLSTFSVDMKNVLAEIEELGDGGDSDVEGELAEELDDAVKDSMMENRVHMDDKEVIEFSDRNVMNLSPSESEKWKDDLQKYVPSYPDDWVPDEKRIEQGEPAMFNDVDNPGNWSEFIFRPEFESGRNRGGKYKGHFLPTGATPLPVGPNGKRTINGWEFFYNGWENESKNGRSNSSSKELFPDSRSGCLDADLLRSLGLNKERMVFGDALFFYQLLLPICNPKKSGIANDPRMAFYSDVTNFSNLYACSIGLLGGQYSHAFKAIRVQELVHFDGVLIRDGALGGSNGALYRRWMIGESMYDATIHDGITYDRFLQLKRTYKLCNNYISGSRSRSDPAYNPAYKYDLIFKVMVANCNALTKYASLDLCGDETTFSHMGYGESNTGLLKRLGQTKPGITRGMQTVMLFDVGRNRPRAYLHRHKLHPNPLKMASGPNECKILLEKISGMVEGSPGNKKKI